MNNDEKELMLDLLCKQATYGLDEQETNVLEGMEYRAADADSIELTVAALGMIDLDTKEEMPAHLHSKILAGAGNFFAAQQNAVPDTADVIAPPVREIVLNETPTARPWFAWLGWAAAAAACVALAVNIFLPKTGSNVAVSPQISTPTPERKLGPAEQRQQLVNSPGQVLTVQLGKGTVKEIADVSGDIVWSDEKQAGYIRVKGLPKNDISKETYQLWIFDETQDPKTPIDGGTFDISSDGEVIIPIDARLKAKNPSLFAVTIEKPGGVVVSDRGRIAALAKRET
jgi:Anti-sigma-K factor rskA